MADLHLHEWCKYGHAYEDRLCDEPTPVGHIAHEHVDDLTVEDFIEKYERPCIPVVISGIVDRWPAKHEWSIEVRVRRVCNPLPFSPSAARDGERFVTGMGAIDPPASI